MKSAYVLRKEVDNAYLVRTRDRRRRRELLGVLIAVAPVGLALLAYSWTHLQVLESGYRIDKLVRELEAMGQAERHLRLEVAQLSDPRVIERRAIEELAMEPPSPEQWVILEPPP